MTERDTIKELDILGSIEIVVRDTNGKKMFCWTKGKISPGILKTLDWLEAKAGIPQDIVLEERERYRRARRDHRRRRP